MFDINAIVNQVINAAVTEATKPLLARIEALESNPAIGVDTTLAARVTALENSATPALAERLHERVTELESKPAVQVDEASMVEAFNSQEWFWEKVRGFVDAGVESAMDDHTTSYDHDQYDEVYNEWGGETTDEFVRDGDIADTVEEKLRDILNNASLSISL